MTVLARKASIGVGVVLLVVLLATPAFAQSPLTTRPVPQVVDVVDVGVHDDMFRVKYYAVPVDLRRQTFNDQVDDIVPFQGDVDSTTARATAQGMKGKARSVDAATSPGSPGPASPSIVSGGLLLPHNGVTAPSRPTTDQLVRDLRSVQDALGL